ncbi:DUF4954 family protein [Planctomycetota bacterium]
MTFDAVAFVKESINKSELLQDLSRGFSSDGYVPVDSEQITILETGGNICDDWSRIYLRPGMDLNRLRGNLLKGQVYMGDPGAEGSMYHCTLEDARIEDNVTLYQSTISNYIIRSGARISQCVEVACSGKTSFGNGVEIPLAIETGGREVLTFAEINVGTAECIAGHRADTTLISAYNDAVQAYAQKAESNYGLISDNAHLVNSIVRDSYIGPNANIDNACLIKNSTVLSNAEEVTEISHGAYVIDSIAQWGAEVTSHAIVDNSVLCEHSHAERHCKVTQSIVGPNTGVAEGEVTASLLGPFVGFHHQSLLIAALWPEGKGNVAHGANIGSNHPSRAPDQEIRPGEGLFIGLDTHVKFPCDFTRAPYTILAAGVLALAQRVEFPFSLINIPSASYEGISPAFMEIRPGWVLSDNIFMVKRNEGKYKKRNKARRSEFVFEVFRPDTVDLMIEARTRLQAVEGRELYTGTDVPGLGKNYLTEHFRLKGIEAYTFYIRDYALRGLMRELKANHSGDDLLTAVSDNARWEHERAILGAEFGSAPSIPDLLNKLAESEKKICEDIRWAKEKDDRRGARIIEDYSEAHTAAADDPFVKASQEEAAMMLVAIEELKKELH